MEYLKNKWVMFGLIVVLAFAAAQTGALDNVSIQSILEMFGQS